MLYNIKKSFATHQIKRGLHTLYFEEYGTRNGTPVIFLHGGPGSGCNDTQKALFNPAKFRVVFLDQRGSGKSTPKRSLIENSTDLLIDDLEFIRKFLDIKKWLIVGGSWGSTLSIAYTQKYPEYVNGIIVRSLFLGTNKEVEWAFFLAPKIFKPRLLTELNKAIDNTNNENPIFKLGEMLENNDPNISGKASLLWLEYESSLASINSSFNKNLISTMNKKNITEKNNLPNTPFLEWHYIKNNFFLSEGQLIKNKKKLEKIPLVVIQADYDLLCPPVNSYLLVDGLSNVKIYNIPAAGHYITDPGIKDKMREAIDLFQN